MARLGDQVDVYCGRCKMERYHTVAALGPSGAIERVVCGYCQTARKFKDPTTSTARRPSQAGVARTRAQAAGATAMPTRPPRRFDVADTYEKDDFIEHGRYGIGRVTDVRGDRIDVKFSDGVRTFMHGKRQA
jgi:hypothetical protein